ncbi:MAG: ATP-binding protein [Anaerolineae bacterium]
MRIRTQFIVTTLLFGIVLAVISVSVMVTNRLVKEANEQDQIAHDIAQGASELSYLANDYVIYREPQQLERWQNRFDAFSRDVSRLQGGDEEVQALIGSIQDNAQRLQDVFKSVVSLVGHPLPGQAGPIDPGLLQVSWSRMAIQTQHLISDVSRLSELLGARVDRFHRTNSLVAIALIGVFGAYFLVNYGTIQRRTLGALARLQAGTARIGAGDLDFRIEEKRQDEIADLSRAFNRMAADLQDAAGLVLDERRRYRELFDFAPDGYVLTDRAGIIQAANQAMGEMLGTEAESLQGQRLERFVVFADVPLFGQFLEQLDAGDVDAPLRAEMRFQHGDREPLSAAVAATVSRSRSGEAEGLRWLLRDVTREKQMQAALVHAEKLSIAGRLAASLAHEINNPLTAALGCADLAIEDVRDGQDPSRHLNIICTALEQAARVVHRLREIQRPPPSEEKRATDLNEMVENVLLLVRRQAQSSGVEIAWQPAEQIPLVEVGVDGIQQVFLNLALNAIEAMDEGGHLAVRIHHAPAADRIGVEFTDDGPGIDPQALEILFEPFNSTKARGSGLGLFVSQNNVQQHDGAIDVETLAGRGTTFTVWLPV